MRHRYYTMCGSVLAFVNISVTGTSLIYSIAQCFHSIIYLCFHTGMLPITSIDKVMFMKNWPVEAKTRLCIVCAGGKWHWESRGADDGSSEDNQRIHYINTSTFVCHWPAEAHLPTDWDVHNYRLNHTDHDLRLATINSCKCRYQTVFVSIFGKLLQKGACYSCMCTQQGAAILLLLMW